MKEEWKKKDFICFFYKIYDNNSIAIDLTKAITDKL